MTNLITSLKSLDVTKATGLDGITPRILKTSAEAVAPTLLETINLSLIDGKFPESLKLAKIKPIHKGGTESDPSNYRPISVLPVISKIVEKHVTKHLFAYLKSMTFYTSLSQGLEKIILAILHY